MQASQIAPAPSGQQQPISATTANPPTSGGSQPVSAQAPTSAVFATAQQQQVQEALQQQQQQVQQVQSQQHQQIQPQPQQPQVQQASISQGLPQQVTTTAAMQQQQPQPSQGVNYAQPQQQQQQQSVQQQQQQQHFPHQGLNGGWQSDKDYQERRKMIAKIVHLLQQRKPNAPQEWLKKLPQMAKRLEESLYRSAKSFEEYNDASTLKNRLQQLAVNIGMKTKRLQQQQALLQQQKLAQQAQQQAQQQQQPPQPQVAQQQQQATTPGQPLVQPQTQQALVAPVPSQPIQPPEQQQPQPVATEAAHQPTSQRLVNLSEINPIMGSQSSQVQQQQPAAPQPTASQPVQQQPQPQQQTQFAQTQQPQTQQQQQPVQPTQLALVTAPSGGTTASGSRQVSDRQQVLRHQQQRLLLLRHAAKCQHDDGRCPVTPHCAGMKRLWKHIAECKNQKCLVPHCVSSRYVLSHYHRCKDVRCPVCGPVREAIHRSHEKQKQMQALKQRHQQAIQQQQQQQKAQQIPSQVTTAAALPTQTQSSSAEPPNKRRRTSQALQPAPGLQVQQRPLSQPSSAPIPPQPKPGFARAQVAAVPGIAFANGQVIMPKHTGPKPQEDHTLINCFSVDQIETHIASLNTGLQLPPQKLKTKCMEVLKVLQSHQHGWVFNSPVDPVELGLPDYFEVIKKPMDLGTIRKKLENGVYNTLEEFEAHVLLTFDNAMVYNPEGSVVYNMAKEMKEKFQHDYAKLLQQLNAEEEMKRRKGEACLLCGCEKLLFEPPVFYCNGFNCPSKRIRRNSYYYVGGSNAYHWCHQCYQELRDNSTIDLGDTQVKKESLVKKKNDEVHEESWVQCDRCERWVHQICALFNTRQNKDQRSEYACPKCTIIERKKKGSLEATSSTPMAEDLPRTKLSEYLEQHVRQKMDAFIEKQSQEMSALERIPIEEAREKLQMGGAITIRQVTSMDRKLEVRERMKKRYAFKDYPDEFTYRCKCIVVFQNIDGVDVVLFGLYIYEHDEKNPGPNKRTVYISYLDSVHYMKPRQMRTFIYHEILISYLDYVRRRGFSSAHIWACPPLKGDDYILYAKPEDQKVPKDERLRQWYVDMLVESQKRGIVGKVTNMYDLYFSDPKNDATVVPYMEGDYFPAEAENIIKDIEEGKSGKKGSSQGKKKDKKAKQKKKKAGRGGTRSTGLDEEALKASGFVPPGSDSKSLQEGSRDYVMVKLGETIQPMKESFIVAYLAWRGAKDEDMVVPEEIQQYREKHHISWKLEDDKAESVKDNKTTDDDAASNTGDKAESTKVDKAESSKDSSVEPKESQEEPSEDLKTADAKDETAKESDPPTNDPPAYSSSKSSESAPAKSEVSDAGKNVESKGNGTEAKDDAMEVDPDPKAECSSDGSAQDTKKDSPLEGTADIEKRPPVENSSGPTPMEGVSMGNEKNEQKVPTSNAVGQKDVGEEKKDPDSQNEAKPDETKSEPKDAKPVVPNLALREGKFAAMAARKRDLEGTPKEAEKKDKDDDKQTDGSAAITVKDSKGRIVKVLDDDEEELDCEFLNNRQAFLNLCQGNHYQFDQLRRAKHSSMMVLWHLHNRDAPKFVQQCATCSREILSGFRFHCPTCADFDQCQDCLRNPNLPRHPHQLKPMPVAGAQQTELTPEQRKERQRSIQLHMTLLLHAASCNSAKCPSANCAKMKGLLKHGAQCQVRAAGGCNVCKRIWALLQIHARQCKAKNCPVPNCTAIRERFRQLKQQQQAMDDRRRLEMNRAYRGKR